LVNGVTAEILYGEDANLNGVLDANENDSDNSAPYDNRDGRLDSGLMEYFTVYSREPASGTNINTQADVQALLESSLSSQRVTEITRQLFPPRIPGTPGGGNTTMRSVLEFYLRSGMTVDEFAPIANSLTATNGMT